MNQIIEEYGDAITAVLGITASVGLFLISQIALKQYFITVLNSIFKL